MTITAFRLSKLLKAEYQAGYKAGYEAANNTTPTADSEIGRLLARVSRGKMTLDDVVEHLLEG